MADLSKILQQESEGIMFPFRTGVQSTTTEQQVYDSATDGIMTVTGQQYTLPEYKGPTATVQYGTEEEGYPRMLREIEQGELPQFRQEDFPKVGEGVMQPSTPVTQPVEPTPTEPEAPSFDPCPAGFVYDPVKKVCVPIEQPKSDRDTPVAEPRNLTDTAKSLKGNIDFTTGTTADDEKFRAGQYDYEPSRKKIEGFNLFSIGMSALHNLDQFFNEKDAMNKGILVDTTGDGKPDKIDMTQVTRNYQEEEIGLPAGARAFGATESLKADVQYDTAKKLYEETQLKGTPPTTTEKNKKPSEPSTGLTGTRTGLTETVTPRFEGTSFVKPDFGMLTEADFGNLPAAIISAKNNITDLETVFSENRNLRPENNKVYKDRYERAQKKLKQLEEADKAMAVVEEYNKQKQKTIQESTEKQTYDKPRTQEQRQRETGQTQKQRESRTATTGKFEREKAGASVSGERLRGGI